MSDNKKFIREQLNNMLVKRYSQPMTTSERIKGGASALPVIGDILSGYDAYQAAKQGNYGEAALNAVGLLPFMPAVGAITKPLSKYEELSATIRNTIPVHAANGGFMSQDVKPVTEWLSNLLSANKVPHETVYSGSSYGPSTYTNIHGLNNETRISNHSKGAFNNQFYNQPISSDDFIDTVNAAIKANPKRTASDVQDILKAQKTQEILNMYPIRLKSADKKISKGKELTRSEQEAIDWRNNGSILP